MRVTHTSPLQALRRDVAKVPQVVKAATVKAANDTIRQGRAEGYAEMRRVFRAPVPYTVPAGIAEGAGALRAEYATANRPDAQLMIRGRGDVPASAIPQQSYLRAEILGGDRHLKRLERLLQRKGVMAAGWFAIPGKGARLDGYGNMSRGQVVQLLAYFEAFGAGNRRSNSTDKSRARLAKSTRRRRGLQYLTIPGPGKVGGLQPGIWERADFGALGKGVRCVLRFVQRVAYRPRLDFYGTQLRNAQRFLPRFLELEAQREAARVLPGALSRG